MVGDPAPIVFFSNFLRNIEPDCWTVDSSDFKKYRERVSSEKTSRKISDFFDFDCYTNTNFIVKDLKKVALENKVVGVGTNLS